MKYLIIKREIGYGNDVAKAMNAKDLSSATVISIVDGTLEDAGYTLLDHLRNNELDIEGDTYYGHLADGERFPEFTVGQDHCECSEFSCEYIIASA